MARCSNCLISWLLMVTATLAVIIIFSNKWMNNYAYSTKCEKFLDKPLIAIGAALLLISLIGLYGAFRGISYLIKIYLIFMFILILVLISFTAFSFVVTNKDAIEVVSGEGFIEYRLGSYSDWLQKRMVNSKNWRKVKRCLQKEKVCDGDDESSEEETDAGKQFFNADIAPIQSGCCKPPTACNVSGFTPTVLDQPTGVKSSLMPDCTTWQKDEDILCYDCQSCKAGVLADMTSYWYKIAIANVIFLIFLIIVFAVGCCAFRDNGEDDGYIDHWIN